MSFDRNVYNKKLRDNNRERNNRLKVELGCVDCGYNDNPVALDWDHVNPEEKEHLISRMIGCTYKWETIMDEIAKCVVRCANCHRIKSLEDFR